MPASPEPQQFTVQQGERREIILHGLGAPGKTIDFILREAPHHGAIEGEPRPLGPDSAMVVYINRAEDGPGTDEFTFAAQSFGGPVSAAVPVSIEIADVPPKLAAVPAELDFGAVKFGDVTRAEVTLQNQGGSVASGRLQPPDPWVVDGESDYKLGRGEQQTFTLIFKPASNRSFVENLHLPNTSGQDVRLVGSGFGAPEPTPAPDIANGALAASSAPADEAAGVGPGGHSTTGPGADRPARANAADAGVSGQPTLTAAGHPSPGGDAGMGLGGALGAAAGNGSPLAANASDDAQARANSAPGSDNGKIWVNTAHISHLDVHGVTDSSLTLAWKPPVPLPRKYRVEIRYLTYDEHAPDNLRIDWRPYAQVDVRPRVDQVTATLHGLAAGAHQTIRVVAVDAAGQLGMPSPQVSATTLPGPTWFRPTTLKILFTALFVCLVWLAYRRWDERQLLREMEESHLQKKRRQADEIAFHR